MAFRKLCLMDALSEALNIESPTPRVDEDERVLRLDEQRVTHPMWAGHHVLEAMKHAHPCRAHASAVEVTDAHHVGVEERLRGFAAHNFSIVAVRLALAVLHHGLDHLEGRQIA